MVLQRKRSQGRTGHMISCVTCFKYVPIDLYCSVRCVAFLLLVMLMMMLLVYVGTFSSTFVIPT